MTKHDKFHNIINYLNDNGGLIFREEDHKYMYNNKTCMSVTTLINLHLSQKSFNNFSKKFDMNAYAEWGSAIHKQIEKYLITGNINAIIEEFHPHVKKAASIINKLRFSEYEVELQVVLASFQLAGTIDVFGILRSGRLAILDWKTAAKPTFKHYLQLCLYRKIVISCWKKMYNEEPEIDLFVACIPRKNPYQSKLQQFNGKEPKEAEAIFTLHKYNYNEEGTYWA